MRHDNRPNGPRPAFIFGFTARRCRAHKSTAPCVRWYLCFKRQIWPCSPVLQPQSRNPHPNPVFLIAGARLFGRNGFSQVWSAARCRIIACSLLLGSSSNRAISVGRAAALSDHPMSFRRGLSPLSNVCVDTVPSSMYLTTTTAIAKPTVSCCTSRARGVDRQSNAAHRAVERPFFHNGVVNQLCHFLQWRCQSTLPSSQSSFVGQAAVRRRRAAHTAPWQRARQASFRALRRRSGA